MTESMLTVLAAIIGAIVGSFLNVCIHRLPRQQSIVAPRSACPQCGRQLAWFENIPFLSYVVLGGRCRTCRATIALQYPLVEIATAVIFAAAWWYYGASLLLVSRLLLCSALIVLFAIDLEHHLLPDIITLPGIAVGLALSVVTEPGWMSSVIGIVAGGGILFAIGEVYYWLRHEEGLGMGDVKMLAMIGAFVGWQLTLVTLLMASAAGSIVGLLLIGSGRGSMKQALPFGTFLACGTVLALVAGSGLIEWYVRFW